MLKKLLPAAILLTLATPASAAVIADLGVNPTSADGRFSNSVGGTTFTDQYTFELSAEFPLYITFASATNDYARTSDFITDFSGQLFFAGTDGEVGGGDDVAMNTAVQAFDCPGSANNCQILFGTALLAPGDYYLQLSGTGGGTAGYGGNLTTAGVPEPATWLLMLLGFVGLGAYARRKGLRLV